MTRPPDGIRLLEPAVRYALTAAAEVTPEFLGRPTPCRGWDLRMLLLHACESLDAIHEGIDAGCVSLYPAARDTDLATQAADPARAFRDRAGRLLDGCASTGRAQAGRRPDATRIADRLVTAGAMAGAGALEIAVHGWDISQACGHGQPIPAGLAAGLLALAPVLVPGARYPLFAAPVSVAPEAGASDQLTAFLGRARVS